MVLTWFFSSLVSGLEIRLMDGKMKGQAFVTFPDANTAQLARNEFLGYVLIDKPLVIVSSFANA